MHSPWLAPSPPPPLLLDLITHFDQENCLTKKPQHFPIERSSQKLVFNNLNLLPQNNRLPDRQNDLSALERWVWYDLVHYCNALLSLCFKFNFKIGYYYLHSEEEYYSFVSTVCLLKPRAHQMWSTVIYLLPIWTKIFFKYLIYMLSVLRCILPRQWLGNQYLIKIML